MSDSATSSAMPKVYSVSELTASLKQTLERDFAIVDLEAEITGWRVYTSGHAYFTLKDDGAQISAVMFKGPLGAATAADLPLGAKVASADGLDGAKVKVRGTVSVYPQRGNYQLVVRRIKLSGEGVLMAQYLALKARLESEGLFSPERKRPLPYMPRRIAIVTSEQGAVIHDMCTVLTRRFPNIEIRLCPAVVQGADAPRSVIAGIRYFNDPANPWHADLLIVGRGGGSFEDLFCFNDEALVRAVAESKIPTISAVGHETDYTLCDFAADRRAGTPSIAAEIAVPVMSELVDRIRTLSQSLTSVLRSQYEVNSQHVDHLGMSLARSVVSRGAVESQRFESYKLRFENSLRVALMKGESSLDRLNAKLDMLSPYSVLDRGYSLTTDANGNVLRDAASVQSGTRILTRLAVGTISSTVN